MFGKVKELWLIVECPECLRPNTVSKYILKDTVLRLLEPMTCNCGICDTPFKVELKQDCFGLSISKEH